MVWELIPEGMRNFPTQVVNSKDAVLSYAPFTEYYKSLNDPSFNQISSSKETDLNGDMRDLNGDMCDLNGDIHYSGFDDCKFSFPQNIKTMPLEMTDMHSMEVDLLQSDDDKFTFSQSVKTLLPEMPSTLQLMDVDAVQSDDSFGKALPAVKVKLPSRIDEYFPRKARKLSTDEIILKSVSVPCLQSLESLKKMCEEQGLKFNVCESSESFSASDETYEVDIIYDHKLIDDEVHYLVKWKNYPTTSNTWEPLCHLEGCKQMIEYYHTMKGAKKKFNKDLLNFFVQDLTSRKPHDILTLTKVCAVCFGMSEKYIQSLKLTISQMKAKVREILTFSPRKIKELETKLFSIMKFAEERKQVLINLKEWECDINEELVGGSCVIVENNVDLETAPSEFVFISDYINTVSSGPSEIVTFCSCGENCFNGKNFCCPNDSDGKFAYNKHKRLILEPGYPIFECNDRCNCPSTCLNRVVQHGQKVKVAIFRTPDKGWGLRAMETIEKGQFVLEYLGEIITSETAEARGRIYDYVGRSYLFDLDYGVDDTASCYTVDAEHYGNVAHFINHSCDPNLQVFAVWINEQDPRLPRLAFFAKRKVCRGEELTFDYKMSKDHFSGDSSDGEESKRIKCKCNTKRCKKYLF